jgi:hypothetical protein
MTEQNNENEIAYKAGKVLGYCCNHPIRALVRATYPLTGNLGELVKDRLEATLGKEAFSSTNATTTSCITNPFVYGASVTCLAYASEKLASNAIMLGGAVLAYGVLETLLRKYGELAGNGKAGNPGSALGKITSLPIEVGIGFYDSFKKQSQTKNSP